MSDTDKFAFEDVSYTYEDGIQALRDVNLRIHANQITAVFGPAGSGKSTLLRLMNRLIDKLQHALFTIGYLQPQKPDHLMFPLRAILSRARLTRTEAQILIGLAQQIDEFAVYGKAGGDEDK